MGGGGQCTKQLRKVEENRPIFDFSLIKKSLINEAFILFIGSRTMHDICLKNLQKDMVCKIIVAAVEFWKKSCSVIYSNSLLIAPGLWVDGKQQVEVQVPNYRLVDTSPVLPDRDGRTTVHRNKFFLGSPQSFQICTSELGLCLNRALTNFAFNNIDFKRFRP